jgi:hypothetical protein
VSVEDRRQGVAVDGVQRHRVEIAGVDDADAVGKRVAGDRPGDDDGVDARVSPVPDPGRPPVRRHRESAALAGRARHQQPSVGPLDRPAPGRFEVRDEPDERLAVQLAEPADERVARRGCHPGPLRAGL